MYVCIIYNVMYMSFGLLTHKHIFHFLWINEQKCHMNHSYVVFSLKYTYNHCQCAAVYNVFTTFILLCIGVLKVSPVL